MGLIEQATQDWQQFTSDSINGFGVDITLKASPYEIVTVVGLHTKHHLGIDTDGNMVNSQKASVSISEKLLADASFPVRNAAGEVAMMDVIVSVKDSTGILKNYSVMQQFPDETIGMIVLILEDYAG